MSIPTMAVALDKSTGPYVIALDVGSTASRGGLYDATGRPVKGSKQRTSHQFAAAPDGSSTVDPDGIVEECRSLIAGLVTFAESRGLDARVKGVALDTFASSMVLVDAEGNALTECFTYADSRCASHAEALREKVDEAAYHQRTGVRLHTSYHPARLAWLKDTYPEEFAQARYAMTIAEYIFFKLAGIYGIATSMASWSGILNVRTGELDREIFDAIGVSPDLIAPVCEPDAPAYPTALPHSWGMLEGAPWFHGLPDGWSSNVGTGAIDETRAGVAAATSGAVRVILPAVPDRIPSGLWCYRLDRNRCIVGGALNDVGRAVAWLERTVTPVENLHTVLAESPLPATPAVLPFFTGERATGWAVDARAAFAGITEATGPAEMWRGVVEGLAISYQRVWEQVRDSGANPAEIVASGRITAEHPQWLQPLSDALRTPVIPLVVKRATLRGTALIALEVVAPTVERATPPFGEAYQPKHEEYYRERREFFEDLYGKLLR